MTSLVSRLRNLLRGRLVIMLLPRRPGAPNDGVAVVASVLRRTRGTIVELLHRPSHFRDVIPERLCPRFALVLFAHPGLGGFAVDTAHGVQHLSPAFWKAADLRCEVLVAHVCEGARVLRQRGWRDVFPRWVSYQADLSVYVGSQRGRSRWERVALAHVAAARRFSSVDKVQRKIDLALLKEMIDIDDRGDAVAGDTLNFVFLQQAREALVGEGD